MRYLATLFVMMIAFGGGAASAAEEWGIDHEKKARFDAKVVDILCELSGDCPAGCGTGKRQLGLLKDDGTLLLVAKNRDIFAGATHDLINFCGKHITADGLYIGNPKMPLFALQFKKPLPDGKWSGATWFIRDWGKTHKTDDKTAAQWFRHDPLIKERIAKDGVFGIPGLKPKE